MTISEKLQQIDKQNKYSGVRFGRVLIVGREILRIIDAVSQAQGRARRQLMWGRCTAWRCGACRASFEALSGAFCGGQPFPDKGKITLAKHTPAQGQDTE